MGIWTKREIEADGVTLSTRETMSSQSPSVFLLHGLGAHQRTWDAVAKYLSDFHLVTYDYRGHGRSSAGADHDVDAFLRDLDLVITTLAHGDYILVGHSIGADLTLLHTQTEAGRCRGVVLVDGAFDISPPETNWERFAIIENSAIVRGLMYVGRLFGAAPSMSISEIRTLTDNLEHRRKHFTEHLAALEVPAMYVIGDQADKVPDGGLIHERKMASIERISATYQVRVEYVPSGHFVPIRQPKRLAELVSGFVASVDG